VATTALVQQTPAPPHWSLAEYDRAIEAGVFGDRRIELIGGALYEMPPMADPHAGAMRYLNDLFITTLGMGRVLCQTPIILPTDSEPEPDVAVARPGSPPRPHAADVQLVIEISDAGRRRFDRGPKLEAYLVDRIPEIWIVDLVERAVLVYRGQLLVGRYAQGTGAELRADQVPEVGVDLDAVFRAAGLTP
jgi:Uma2 family endonuclease